VSLFVCRTRRELTLHVRRLLVAQLLCIACFLAFPLRFSFSRPVAGGVFGALFAALAGFDKPFNQAPSLHIALLVILWSRYAAHLGRAGRALLHGWFVLIALSVLTTYQHHFLDIPTGIWAGLFCLWLVPEAPPAAAAADAADRSRDPRRLPLALAYLAAGAALASAGLHLGGWGWLLLWPAGALILLVAIYCTGDAGLFRKAAGRMSAPARWLLLPYLAGAWLNSRLWTRRSAAPDLIADGVLVGRIPTGRELRDSGVRSLVDLAAELPLACKEVTYRAVPMLDLLPPSVRQIDAAVDAVAALAAARPTLLCCALGYGRSACVAAAWLLASGRAAGIDDAMAKVRRARPGAVLSPAHRRQLVAWQATRRLLDAG
jgi:protein-tyrosine phosphatase